MGAVKAEDKEKYYETSRTWEYDRMRAAIQSKRLAWGVAAGACTLAVASVSAVAMLSPLKTVEPYVIRVDKSSGETQVVTALKGPQARTYEDAVNRYFISQYVRLREGWLNDAARENAYTVMLTSDSGRERSLLEQRSGQQQERALQHLWRQGLRLDLDPDDQFPQPYRGAGPLHEDHHLRAEHADRAKLERDHDLQIHDGAGA